MAARALVGKRVLMLDVGRQPVASAVDGLPRNANLYEQRRTAPDLFGPLIGENFESLHNLHQPPVSLKLKSPGMRYVVDGADSLSPTRTQGFEPTMSFATGGLANAWGAGVYRFTAQDLADFPITVADLDPFYDDLTRHIGISGALDDTAPWFGSAADLLPPIELSRFASGLLDGYQRHRDRFHRIGVSIGRARNAVLTRPHRGREAYQYGNMEFFRAHDPAVFNPAYTLRELVDAGRVEYLSNHLAVRYREVEGFGVEVEARDLSSGTTEAFAGRTLILAAGALNSAKLVLESNEDYKTRLPLLDNPMACLPLFRPQLAGKPLDRLDSSLGQLNLIQEFDGTVLQGSIYGAAGPLRSDVVFELPLAIRSNVEVLGLLAAASGLLMMFYPSAPHPENHLSLGSDGTLQLQCRYPEAGCPSREASIRALIPAFWRIGFLASIKLCPYPPMGAGIHYAGTLPMKDRPSPYELDPDGRLFGTRSVYVADGACFPRLPSKNLTFTIMANAMRIATKIRERVL